MTAAARRGPAQGAVIPSLIWIDDEMNTRGWSRAKLARSAGVSANTISNILSGKTPANDSTLSLIRRAFEADPEGTAFALGSTAARGAVDKMIHENKYFADIYLAFKDLSEPMQEEARNFVVELRLRRGAKRESESPEGDL